MTDQLENNRELDTSSRDEFFDYYSHESQTQETLNRLTGITDTVLRVLGPKNEKNLDIADIGCGAGTLGLMWSSMGHNVYGLDINEPLIELAKKRAEEKNRNIKFYVGTATELPWDNASMDVCLVPELLEHVQDWQTCLDEFTRILKPGGVLYLSTNNKLCPKQQEFDLPMYSWYPGFIKHYCEKLAVTSHPQIAGYATYPAVNWFTYYILREEFRKRGLLAYDRFDVMDLDNKGRIKNTVISMIKKLPALRLLGHIFTPYTTTVGIKQNQ